MTDDNKSNQMNNWIGLLIALSLAMIAGVLNWKYLERKTDEVETVSFVAIKDGVSMEPGDKFLENHFAKLDVPKKNAGYLQQSAVLFEDRHTVVSMKALHRYRGGDVILRQELKTPPEELNLEKGELGFWVPVGGTSFVSSLITPGDMVSFYISTSRGIRPTLPTQEPETEQEDPEKWNLEGKPQVPVIEEGPAELIGPFRVISVGPRLGSFEVSRAAGTRSAQENVLGIAIKTNATGLLEPQGMKLKDRVLTSGFRQAGVLLHPRTKKTGAQLK